AADLLDRLDFRGRTILEFAGPRPLTFLEATTALGKAIGKPDLKYVQFPYAEAERAMVGSGMKASFAGLITEMDRALNEGKIEPTQPFPAENRGKTTIEEFAKVFARAYTTA
ncbi:MAG: FMN-dependent NADH-azoreductase, partial [Planctomycetota bacterium]